MTKRTNAESSHSRRQSERRTIPAPQPDWLESLAQFQPALWAFRARHLAGASC
ncbi:MAG: hypothetical protein MZV64_02260 [Ignavibacteriales bacterium]|nr:hypothetical protein [Ignavibacteriales bacterium]